MWRIWRINKGLKMTCLPLLLQGVKQLGEIEMSRSSQRVRNNTEGQGQSETYWKWIRGDSESETSMREEKRSEWSRLLNEKFRQTEGKGVGWEEGTWSPDWRLADSMNCRHPLLSSWEKETKEEFWELAKTLCLDFKSFGSCIVVSLERTILIII